MSISRTDTLADFHRFVGQQLSRPETPSMSPEEALARWQERQDTVAAIREGLADVEAGRTRPVEIVIQDLRTRHSSRNNN